jgi:OOP family OmpA-OmpF porin
MKNLTLYIIFLFATIKVVNSQNLVKNFSFEDSISCPQNQGDLSIENWTSPNMNSPDYFHTCNNSVNQVVGIPANMWGYQFPPNNFENAFVGVGVYYTAVNGREYVTGNLSNPLEIGKSYIVSFRVSLGDSVKFATDKIGLFFHDTIIYQNNIFYLDFQPQIENAVGNYITDKTNWVLIEGIYVAEGGEKFITLGNFYPDSLTDIIPTNSLPLGSSNKQAAYFYIDDVYVGEYIEPTFEENKLDILPNPATELINFSYELKEEDAVLKIYNVIGQIMSEENLIGNNGTFTLNLYNFSQGMYFATIIQNDKKLLVKKFNVIK